MLTTETTIMKEAQGMRIGLFVLLIYTLCTHTDEPIPMKNMVLMTLYSCLSEFRSCIS